MVNITTFKLNVAWDPDTQEHPEAHVLSVLSLVDDRYDFYFEELATNPAAEENS